MSLLLDTTVLIDVLRGRSAAERLQALRDGDAEEVPFVCAVTVDELHQGLRKPELRVAERLVRGLRTAALGKAEGRRAGTWRRDFAAKGITLSQADCLIAAAAVGIGARLATGNPKDFPMKELRVEHWPVGR